MPRPKGTIPPAIRVRDNQRRARARQKELIEEMRAKIQEYEQRGVQASAELQRAARKVAWENVQLRNLLGAVGVGKERVEGYLEGCRVGGGGGMGEGGVGGVGDVGRVCGKGVGLAIPEVEAKMVETSSVKEPGVELSICQDVGADHSNHPTVEQASTIEQPVHGETTIAQTPHVPQPPDENIYEDNLKTPQRIDQQETSCVIAANIIAGMRWNTDPEETLTALGCNGSRDCSVKNTTVFQVMDMS